MGDCSHLIHPFQHDPGVSQSQRVMNNLVNAAPAIDGRSLADLLNYFVQLSGNINFYEDDLQTGDWRPFFSESLPFLLAAISKIQSSTIQDKFSGYDFLFRKDPSRDGLQLTLFYVYFNTIKQIETWYDRLKDSGLPVGLTITKLIRNKLQQPLRTFISLYNAGVKYYCIRKIDFSGLSDAWGLQKQDLYGIDDSFLKAGNSNRKRLMALEQALVDLLPSLMEALNVLPLAAEDDIALSLLPLIADQQKKHEPHLALIFVFLNMFLKLQNDLNGFTKKHLDFFYQQVLQLKPEDPVPDMANILFELQNQLQSHLVEKGTLIKDGKDNNKVDIQFSTDDDLVVNKTTVTDIRTLFLNNQVIQETDYLEGVYIANNATMADGVDKAFTADQSANYPTMGAKDSKYMAPGTDYYKPYANARLGFILASPVLLMNEGKRTVNITLACQLFDPATDAAGTGICQSDDDTGDYPRTYSTQAVFKKVKHLFRQYFVYISMDLINEAEAMGISKKTIQLLKDSFLLEDTKTICNLPVKTYFQDNTVTWGKWWSLYYSGVNLMEKAIIDLLFAKKRLLKISFSGVKDWVIPTRIKRMRFTPLVVTTGLGARMTFAIKIKAVIEPDKPAVSFYNLDENFDNTLPLVKIELDDTIKIKRGIDLNPAACCLDRPVDNSKIPLSFYYFFRNLKVISQTDIDVKGHIFNTGINISVCGLKNFIVQNDESLQDVNSPVYPFGTRPKLSSNFYIGSKEIFYKDWTECFVNINWKDRPDDFTKYYEGYENKITPIIISDFANANFKVQKYLLYKGQWISDSRDRIFPDAGLTKYGLNDISADSNTNYDVHLKILPGDFGSNVKVDRKFFYDVFTRYDASSANGFLQLSLLNDSAGTPVDFQQSNYPFILARQMTAFGKLPNDIVDGAVYYDTIPLNIKVLSSQDLLNAYLAAKDLAKNVNDDIGSIDLLSNVATSGNPIAPAEADPIRKYLDTDAFPTPSDVGLVKESATLKQIIDIGATTLQNVIKYAAIIPSEPWTPIISSIALDYTAQATLVDIDLIHLYPYAGTYKHEEIQLQPTLFPSFCDEGNLFLGLQDLVPGENVNMLFQLAEATSNSESDPEDVHWHFLDTNVWKPLRAGFEVLKDDTENLTTSGIIKLSLPANMTDDNTIMPAGLHWIKATIPQNSSAVSETTGIYTQAISVTFTNEDANDKLRLNNPLPAGSLAKLAIPDSGIKAVIQPYDSFGGAQPEVQSSYYIRVSELLRHKGRAIQKFDYERLVLEAFPQLFKAKCINHSFALNAYQYINDFPVAPGYVLLAVIPDLNVMKAGNSFQPKAPVSLLEKIETYIRAKTSPFVRFRAMNPRYETVHFALTVKLLPGKDKNFFKEKLTEDIRDFMAPWAIGDFYKLTFGQCVNRSQVVQFIETRDYVDFILELKMHSDEEPVGLCAEPFEVCPLTPRSILIAGDIDVCIPDDECESWAIPGCGNDPIPLKEYCKK